MGLKPTLYRPTDVGEAVAFFGRKALLGDATSVKLSAPTGGPFPLVYRTPVLNILGLNRLLLMVLFRTQNQQVSLSCWVDGVDPEAETEFLSPPPNIYRVPGLGDNTQRSYNSGFFTPSVVSSTPGQPQEWAQFQYQGSPMLGAWAVRIGFGTQAGGEQEEVEIFDARLWAQRLN